MPIGTIESANRIYVGIQTGKATAGEKKYEIIVTASGSPIVRSLQTGKHFLLTWNDILNLAVEEGIDD